MTTPPDPYVLVVGGANIDVTGVPRRVLRERDSNPGSISLSCGGVARNVAENLARLGVDARLATMLGNDQYGEMIVALSRAAGIDMQYTQVSEHVSTPSYLSILDETGDMRLAIADMAVMDRITPDWLETIRHAFEKAALILIDANLPAESIEWICGEFSGLPIFADAVSSSKATRLRPVLTAIHTLKLNSFEARALAGIDGDEDAVMDELHRRGANRLFITHGAEGVSLSSAHERTSATPARTLQRAHNSGGAGDAFLAGTVFAWLQDWPLDRTVRFAMAAAEVTATARATSNAALSLNAINEWLELEGG